MRGISGLCLKARLTSAADPSLVNSISTIAKSNHKWEEEEEGTNGEDNLMQVRQAAE